MDLAASEAVDALHDLQRKEESLQKDYLAVAQAAFAAAAEQLSAVRGNLSETQLLVKNLAKKWGRLTKELGGGGEVVAEVPKGERRS